MDTFSSDMPADCQSAAADSTTTMTTTTTTTTSEGNNSNITTTTTTGQQQRQCIEQQPQVSSTTAVATATTTTSADGSAIAKVGSPPPATTTTATATTANNNNNNNNNKIKSQQQQQQQQQQAYHQFRAPQQFVRQRRTAAATLTKKNKAWNKRQNKTTKQQQQQQQHNLASLAAAAAAGAGVLIVGGQAGAGAGGAATAGGVGGGLSGAGNLATTKADLENIQIFKNQLGSHQYYHHHGHRGGNGGGGGADGRTAGNGLPPASLAGLEKLGYGHGHLKQQLYKKMLLHRGGGGHHHVLCAGAAHNTLGGIGGGVGGNPNCCLVNGCSAQNGKDAAGNVGGGNNSISSSVSQTLHYCCGRSKFFLPDKRLRKEIIIPPTKFLLGGNISDPLNLNSLQNETSNASSNNNTPATTPRQSPITTPPKVEVIIPPNIHDPLHLLDPVDSMEYEKQLTSPMKRGQRGSHKHPHHHKHRHRKNRKPKRRRYESYNSSSSVVGLELEERSTSSLGNSTMLTETSGTLSVSLLDSSGNNSNNNSSQCSNSTSANVSNVSSTHAAAAGAALDFVHEEREENALDASKFMRSVEEHAERNMSPLLSNAVSGMEGELSAGMLPNAAGAANVLAAGGGDLLPRERASRDLRLELNSTTSSTCSSQMGTGSGAGTGRKRKISESNNSQKNKKFHRLDSMDKIVSPVVPQPGAWKRPPRLAASGARKPARRSTSVSETEVLSPADEVVRPLTLEADLSRVDTPDFNKLETVSEAGLGSPLSTASGNTSVAAGEQESLADTSVGDNSTNLLGDESNIACSTTTTAAVSTSGAGAIAQLTKMPKFRADGAKYRYGNYDRYVGFRHLNEFMDVRLKVFQRHMELFQNKDILDIGCNVGHMTITIARNLAPKSILGIDIDKELIARARRNLALYVRIPPEAPKKEEPTPPTADGTVKAEAKAAASNSATTTEGNSANNIKDATSNADATTKKPKKTRRKKKPRLQQQQLQYHLHHHHHHFHYHQQQQQLLQLQRKLHVPATELFPISFPLTYGGIPHVPPGGDAHSPSGSTSTPGHASNATTSNSGTTKSKNDFPRNVFFRQTNYVLKDESQLSNDTQQYDLILCLSVTKWIHLNFGDAGLKLAFKRMFNQLRPGGKLILEAQNWASYKKKKNLTEEIYHNYRNIEFFPNKFHEYLLSSEVGFSHSYTLGVPRHLNKGFCRPIQLYAKGDYTPNHVRWSDAYYPQTPYEAYRGIYATMPPRPAGLATYAMSSTRSQAYDTPHYTGGTSGPYSRRQTPMYQPTSQYYNPLETDSYLPSYDMEYLNHMYVFASPLYQTVWSPPASLRNSSSHTPVFGSVREAELDGDGSGGGGGGSYHRHVYPPNEDTSSPNANAGGAFSSIRDPDTDDSNQLPAGHVQHVYATNCGESSSSPQVHHHDSETIDESLMLDEELPVGSGGANPSGHHCCDLGDA